MFFCMIAKSLCNRCVTRNFVRFATTDYRYCTQFVVPLSKRKLIKISGTDASEFLQGLVTNDMRHFEDNAKSMYTMFLNNRGRVLFDSLIHKWDGSNQYLMECDKAVSTAFLKHLNLFKLKRDVKLEDMDDKYKLWVILSEVNVIPEMEFDPQAPVNILKDPRLTELGGRIIATADTNVDQIVNTIGPNSGIGEESLYKYIRYKLGVGEGAEDLPSGTCFPLESNCDYLHGVSFHKGCYLGQELTARIHHTGVIRKRLMPIKFNEPVNDFLEKDAMITPSCDAKYNIGKLRGVMHDIGLGLVKVKDALDSKAIKIRSYTAEIYKPNWWPKEAPKEKIAPKAE